MSSIVHTIHIIYIGFFQSVQAQPAAAMSSATISDIDLPLRYRRQPLSQEEIDTINGGGVV